MIEIKQGMAVVAVVILEALALEGCGGQAANSPPPVTAASPTAASPVDDVSSGLVEHHRYHHQGGVTLFIAMSLDTLGVSPEQRLAVEKIRGDLRAKMEPARAADQNLVATLADGLSASSFDQAKVQAALGQVKGAAAGVLDASMEALSELHAVLTPPQRAALVDKVEAHWAVWQEANDNEAGPPNQRPGGRLSMLVMELELTPEQVTKIRAALAIDLETAPRLDRERIATHLRTFAEAFRAETFDAKALSAGSAANQHLVDWAGVRLARFVEAVSPILTADQRAELAQRLREHATHNPNSQENS